MIDTTIAAIALLVTVLSALVVIAYKAGQNSNKIENLEVWRIEYMKATEDKFEHFERMMENSYRRLEGYIVK